MARTYHPPFSNFLFTNLFSIKCLYFFIISSLFLILTCSCQYSYNLMLTSNYVCRPYIDTNNPGRHMQFDINMWNRVGIQFPKFNQSPYSKQRMSILKIQKDQSIIYRRKTIESTDWQP